MNTETRELLKAHLRQYEVWVRDSIVAIDTSRANLKRLEDGLAKYEETVRQLKEDLNVQS